MSRKDIAVNARRQALVFLGLNAVGACAAGLVHASTGTPDEKTRPSADASGDPARADLMRRHFPNVPLQTHDGRSVRFYDDLVKGRKVIINFTFTTCTGTCPRTSANLARVQELLGDRIGRDMFIVSLTIDPAHDTPAVLADYARSFEARPGWTFATGKIEDINAIRRRLGLYDSDDITQHLGLPPRQRAGGQWRRRRRSIHRRTSPLRAAAVDLFQHGLMSRQLPRSGTER